MAAFRHQLALHSTKKYRQILNNLTLCQTKNCLKMQLIIDLIGVSLLLIFSCSDKNF